MVLTTNPPSSRLRRDRWTRIYTKDRTTDYTDNTDWERARSRAPTYGAASLFPTIRDICVTCHAVAFGVGGSVVVFPLKTFEQKETKKTKADKSTSATVALPQSVVFAVGADPFPKKSAFHKFSHRPVVIPDTN